MSTPEAAYTSPQITMTTAGEVVSIDGLQLLPGVTLIGLWGKTMPSGRRVLRLRVRVKAKGVPANA